jgi:phenylacetate-CoA ligase
MFEPEGHAKDWWNVARALFAAGIRKGDILLNCFSYHLSPGGHIFESGAQVLGCPVIPAGTGNSEQLLEAIQVLKPAAYCGGPDFLKTLLDRADELGRDISCIRRGLVNGGHLSPAMREEFASRGIEIYQAYGTDELGIVAYESEAKQGLIVNEGLILEIVGQGTNEPLPPGEMGEIVVTRLNADYPLLRFGTGDLSMLLKGQSACGRTNMRIEIPFGDVDQALKLQLAELTELVRPASHPSNTKTIAGNGR